MRVSGLVLAGLSGAVWGVAFWSWGLPLPIPIRVVATVLLLTAMSAASPAGRLAAAAFALCMGASSALLLASSGRLFFDWWGLVPAGSLVAGLALVALAIARSAPAAET